MGGRIVYVYRLYLWARVARVGMGRLWGMSGAKGMGFKCRV